MSYYVDVNGWRFNFISMRAERLIKNEIYAHHHLRFRITEDGRLLERSLIGGHSYYYSFFLHRTDDRLVIEAYETFLLESCLLSDGDDSGSCIKE